MRAGRRARTVLGLLLAAAAAGCLEARSTTVLNADGSGTYTETVTVDLVKTAGYQRALRSQLGSIPMGEDPEAQDPLAPLDVTKREAALKRHEGVRVTAKQDRVDKEKKTRTFDLTVAFASLRALYAAGVVDDATIKLERVKKGKAWRLTIRHVFDGNDREPVEGPTADTLARLRKAMLARYEAWWGSLRVERTLTLPTRVLETNGTKAAGGRSVTWRIGFDDLADPRALRQVVTFEHDPALKLAPFELTANDSANAKEAAALEGGEK